MIELTQQQQQMVNDAINLGMVDKPTAKKLVAIYQQNNPEDQSDQGCMCSHQDRMNFLNKFTQWYKLNTNTQ